MSRPLYLGSDRQREWRGGHAGLWYDKFFDRWTSDHSDVSSEGKKQWILSMTERPVGDRQQLSEHQARLMSLLDTNGQRAQPYKLEADFVTGLGRAHPVENGFAWHHTLGTPYLPGSSVKGMIRAWATQWAGADGNTLKRIFGSESTGDKQYQVGTVIFLDALPIEPVQLKADVMTPHYGAWYQDGSPPADWHSPVPVPFLVVEEGASFSFGLLPRRNDEKHREDCERAHVWLREALAWLGAGAKTAVGYGRFGVDQEAEAKRARLEEERAAAREAARLEAERQKELAAMPLLLRQMHEEGYAEKDFIGNPMNAWLERMDSAEGEERREIAQHLQDWYETHSPDQWRKPNKKNQAKIERIRKALAG